MEKSSYKSIENEYEREQKVHSARSEQAKEKQQLLYQQAQKVCEETIREYDDFSYLYFCLINELNVFDKEGNLRPKQQAEGVIEYTLLALIISDYLNFSLTVT